MNMRTRLAVILFLGAVLLFGLAGACTPATLAPSPAAPSRTALQPSPTSAELQPPAMTPTALSAEGQPAGPTPTLPPPASPTSLPRSTGTPTPTIDPTDILEAFELPFGAWQVIPVVTGSGDISGSSDLFYDGTHSARLDLRDGTGTSTLNVSFRDAALEHTWGERPGTWHWFRAYVYVPSTSLAGLGAEGYLTLGGIYASGPGTGWYLRLRENGDLYVMGHRDWDNTPIEFPVYGVFPQDRWVQLELGLHSQAGPGVKRAFAFLIDGDFYGWYHQGRMKEEVYDSAALGLLSTNASTPLTVYVDTWFQPTSAPFPSGSDNRPSADLQEQDFTLQDGRQWQIDWTTWENNLRLDPVFGLYSLSARFQAGRNLDRMPSLESGWAEMESDWPQGKPPANDMLLYSFGGLVAFRKEINREENLEVGYTLSDGQAQLYYCAWTGMPEYYQMWPLPAASDLSDGRNLPEPGDILRVRWEQVSEGEIRVRASFYDASAERWYLDVIDDRRDLTSLADADPPGERINFMDGYHLASAVTADSPYYSIRRYRVGRLETYPEP
jgi:hypothetical protein